MEKAGGIDTRVYQFSAVSGVVAAVDTFAAEVDEHIRAVEHTIPVTPLMPVPPHLAGMTGRTPGEEAHGVALLFQKPRQTGPEIAAAARDDEAFHIRPPFNNPK